MIKSRRYDKPVDLMHAKNGQNAHSKWKFSSLLGTLRAIFHVRACSADQYRVSGVSAAVEIISWHSSIHLQNAVSSSPTTSGSVYTQVVGHVEEAGLFC